MTHPIIKTDNYLLVVDESEIKDDVWHLDNGVIKKWKGNLHSNRLTSKKIICHLPLNNASTLEGVELLPPLEDEAEKFAESKYPKNTDSFYDKGWDESICPKRILSLLKDLTNSTSSALMIACKIGYNKAKEKYKYTEKDVRKAIEMARELDGLHFKNGAAYKIIQSLQQPKYPVAFESEMKCGRCYKPLEEKDDCWSAKECCQGSNSYPDLLKTITNSQGLIQVVGKYIY
jgi:hypothetical protein